MAHPEVARIDCDDCAKRQYEFAGENIGKPLLVQIGPAREWVDSPHDSPPCHRGFDCPKGTKETAHEKRLTERNWRTLDLFMQHRTCGVLPDDFCAELADAFVDMERLFKRHDSNNQARKTANELARVLMLMRR